MTMNELEGKVKELQELKRMREELDAEIEATQDIVKAFMGDQETVMAGAYKVTWKPVESTRIDTASLKKALPEIAARFTVKSITRRFCVN